MSHQGAGFGVDALGPAREGGAMSISIAFVARTGVVLGTDSRVTTRFPEGQTREDAYPKLVQFGRMPVGLAMVGAGSYGGRDFRSLVAEAYRHWIDDEAREETVEGVAQVFARVGGDLARQSGSSTRMDVLVGGYTPGEAFGELWEVILPSGEVKALAQAAHQTFIWRGQTDAVMTLWWGADLHALGHALEGAGLERDAARKVEAAVKKRVAWGPQRTNWGMPLSSAVDLVRFQLEVQITAERFLPGRGRCGPPTQIVAINDSGLTWVDRPFGEFSDVVGESWAGP